MTMSSSNIAIAGMAALAALGCDSIPDFSSDYTGFKSVGGGNICGWDNGKDKKKLQSRNAQCSCGSGKKSKKCCIYIQEVK